MLSLRKPSADALRRFLAAQRELPFTYEAMGATAETPPAGYVVDRTRIKLGEGEAVFRSAIAALRRWEQFNLGWVEAWPSETPVQKGNAVAVMGRAVGVWWLNACRVVYVLDKTGPISKFGFAYGTLPGHVESGDILAFSRPNHVLTRLGYPVVRRLQKRFGRDSAVAMRRAVGAGDTAKVG
jgi:uncharacterized protein (UPF0548 family)